MEEKPHLDAKHKALIMIISHIILVIMFAISFAFVRSCAVGGGNKKECSSENEVRQVSCPTGEQGRRLEICKSSHWEESFNDCKAAGSCKETVFDVNIKPLIDGKCVSCHPGYNEYDTAKGRADQFIERTSLADDSPLRMPKAPNAPLSADEKTVFTGWKEDGLLASCPGGDGANNNPHLDLNYIESSIEQDLSSLNFADQQDARYLLISHKSNEKAPRDALAEFVAGINKGINSISFARDIILAKPVDEHKTVYRFFLRDLKLKALDWKIIEDNDPVNFESFTNLGRLIKSLTKTRKPMLHVDTFNFTANQAKVYHAIRKIPANLNDFNIFLGVNFVNQLNDFTALHVGLETSRVSLNKNRLITRFDSNDGNYWFTSDILSTSSEANNNLLKAPLLKSVSGGASFLFDGSEVIASIANGLHLYALFDAKGNRVDAGPTNLVADYLSPFSVEIANSLSCYRCHNAGLIPVNDQIREAVLDAGALTFDDAELVQRLYRDPAPVFTKDNGPYQEALSKMGILATDTDPINLTSDNLRRDHTALSVASLLFLTEEEFLERLSRSAQGRALVGQLLSGGKVTSQQLFLALPVLIKELRANVEPI